MAKYLPATKTIIAPDIAKLFVNEVACRFGLPKRIVNNRGSLFTGDFWANICRYAKIKQRLSTAFYP